MSELERLRKNVFDNLQEIERLNNIINELEKWINIQITCSSTQDYGVYKCV